MSNENDYSLFFKKDNEWFIFESMIRIEIMFNYTNWIAYFSHDSGYLFTCI
jgi:hypothetical protein